MIVFANPFMFYQIENSKNTVSTHWYNCQWLTIRSVLTLHITVHPSTIPAATAINLNCIFCHFFTSFLNNKVESFQQLQCELIFKNRFRTSPVCIGKKFSALTFLINGLLLMVKYQFYKWPFWLTFFCNEISYSNPSFIYIFEKKYIIAFTVRVCLENGWLGLY